MATSVRQPGRPSGDYPRGLSRLHTTLVLLMLTLAAAAAGGIFGLQVHALVEKSLKQPDQTAEFPIESLKSVFLDTAEIRSVPPVITDLAGSKRVWVRLESSIVLAGEPSTGDDLLAAKIGEDLLAFLRTITPEDIEGPTGFEHLREDLIERARVRSNGRVRDLVIHSFIVE